MGFKGITSILLAWPFVSFYWAKKKADRSWSEKCMKWELPGDVESVKALEILPLIDWYADDEDLATEPGVSYLIKTEESTVLFDVGYNMKREHPSPLLRNMSKLGISFDQIDTIIISHPHADHVGGDINQLKRQFSPSKGHVDLSGKKIFLPPGMSHPDFNTMQVQRPVKIARGIISTGPIYSSQFILGNTLFPMGITPEQALVVDIKGHGVVIIVGCGHQGLERILKLVDHLFDKPVYGIVGGLHYPVTESRMTAFGGRLEVQKYFGTGKLPWSPITKQEVLNHISMLRKYRPKLVSLSAHDSCDWSINAFREAFGPDYKDLKVGKSIRIPET